MTITIEIHPTESCQSLEWVPTMYEVANKLLETIGKHYGISFKPIDEDSDIEEQASQYILESIYNFCYVIYKNHNDIKEIIFSSILVENDIATVTYQLHFDDDTYNVWSHFTMDITDINQYYGQPC